MTQYDGDATGVPDESQDFYSQRILDYTSMIDKIDEDIASMIGERTRIAKRIGQLKQQSNLPANDIDREQQVITNYKFNAECHGWGYEGFGTPDIPGRIGELILELGAREQ